MEMLWKGVPSMEFYILAKDILLSKDKISCFESFVSYEIINQEKKKKPHPRAQQDQTFLNFALKFPVR